VLKLGLGDPRDLECNAERAIGPPSAHHGALRWGLTCMRLLAQCVPRHLEATALTIYGTVGIGIATALLTLACGPIFERFGAHGFWAMAALCAAALPLTLTLREPMAGSR